MDRRKKILNFHEEATNVILKKAASANGARIFPKVRIADVLEIASSGLSDDQYGYVLKAHFDFVVTDQQSKSLFAVEFDGPHHELSSTSRANDAKKNAICERLDFPLLRITADFLTRKVRQFSLLGWLVELWFMNQAFCRAQEEGAIPYDEDFDYHAVLSNSVEEFAEGKITCPYDPTLPARILIRKCYESGLCKDYVPSVQVSENVRGYHTATALIRVNDEQVIVGKAKCRSFQFDPVSGWELSQELAVADAGAKLRLYTNGKQAPSPIQRPDGHTPPPFRLA